MEYLHDVREEKAMPLSNQSRDVERFLSRTHQRWKLRTALVIASVGTLTILGGWSGAFASRQIPLLIFGAACGLIGLGLASIGIKCPMCGSRLFWRALSEQSAPSAYSWLTTLNRCPKCGG